MSSNTILYSPIPTSDESCKLESTWLQSLLWPSSKKTCHSKCHPIPNACIGKRRKTSIFSFFFHRSDDPLELSFPHIKLASPEDELLNKSLLESLTPASPSSSAPYRLPKLSCTGSVSSTCTSGSDRSEGALRNGQSLDGLSPRSQSKKSKWVLAKVQEWDRKQD